VLIKVLIAEEVSTLEKSRVSSQGAHDVQGAHFDLSTLDNAQLRSAMLKTANGVGQSGQAVSGGSGCVKRAGKL
jgi:hypothetical protein